MVATLPAGGVEYVPAPAAVARLAPRPSAPAARPVRAPARTYRRRQAVAASLAGGVLVAVWAALGSLGGGTLPASERPGPAVPPPAPGAVHVVQPGDSFWSIATALAPGRDPRPLVDRLVAAHGGAGLQVGERLVLPAL